MLKVAISSAVSLYTLHPPYRHVLRPQRFTNNPEAAANVAAFARITTRHYWEMVEEKMSDTPWLLGDCYSVADAYLLVFWMWSRGKTLEYEMPNDFPKWTAHAKRMATRPAVQRAYAREGLALPE